MAVSSIVGTIVSTLDPTPSDWATTITTAFAGFLPALMAVAAVGLGIAVTTWGFPKVVGFFKRTAK